MFTTKSGEEVGRLGLGTWRMGEDKDLKRSELESLMYALDEGVKLLDTAEMYGSGRSESLLGQAISSYPREDIFLVSKVLPSNAGKKSMERSLKNTLKRLGTDYLDLYLLHWRGSIPLEETIDTLLNLKDRGLIRAWGVSNFDIDDLKELKNIPGGETCSVNQVLYHLGSRGIEYDLKPYMDQINMPLMAYCPMAQAGRLREGMIENKAVNMIAKEIGGTPYQVLLLFLLSKENVYPIPKAGKIENMKENLSCLNMSLTEDQLALLDREYPAPDHKVPLDIE